MIKKYKLFLESNKETYYNSHGSTMPFSEFIELEVEERENYEMEEVKEWMEEFNFDENSECIWVTKDKRDVYRYHLTADYWDEIDNGGDINQMLEKEFGGSDNVEVYEYDSSDGVIIEDTDDGDGGFLFILN